MTPMSRAERFHALVRGDTRGPLAWAGRAALWWARLPYGVGVWARNHLFDAGWRKAVRVPVPVVSVGNLTLGGTGKTPCVEYVAKFYRELGVRTAILSRGYGADAGRNDEAMVLEENLPDVPHLQGANRVELAMTAVAELDSEVLILDDGFQHRHLARDLDIVLVDGTRPLAGDYLFPRGTLREPIASLHRADVIIVTHCDAVSSDRDEGWRPTVRWLRLTFPNKLVLTAAHVPVELLASDGRTLPHDAFRSQVAAAFCGIGNPRAFESTVFSLTFEHPPDPTWFRTYPDHHNYTRTDVDDLRAWAATLPEGAPILTTQKDLVKLRLTELAGRPLWAVRIEFRVWDEESELFARLRQVIPEAVA